MLLIEHDTSPVRQVTDRIVVRNFGGKIAEGTPEAVWCNPAVVLTRLGGRNR